MSIRVYSWELQQRLAEQNRLLAATLERLKDTQSQLVQAEKLTSLGRLSAGIIHEINNPLNFAATGLYALRTKQRHLPGEHQTEFNEIMRDVEEGISRVRNIVSDLRTFTFPNAAPTDDVNLADTIAVALRFLSHEWTRQVKVLSYLPAGLTVRANRNKLVQVFVNLLQNAADALKRKVFDHGGPQIEIEGRSPWPRTACRCSASAGFRRSRP